MVYKTIIGHTLQFLGLFFAFLATALSFMYANLIRGGVVGKASLLNSIGFSIISINIFLIYGSAISGRLSLLNVNFILILVGFLSTLGFGLIAYSQYITWRVTIS